MKFLFSDTRFHGLQKPALEHSSKQGKGSTFCTLLVGALPGPAGPLFAENDPLDHFPGAQSPKPLLPAQALWLLCESVRFVIMMGGVFIEVVIFWYDMLVTLWCAVPFQNFVVIPDMLQACELWLQLVQRCLIVFFLLL